MRNNNDARNALAAHRPLTIRLSTVHQSWIVVALATLLLSGIAWLILDRWVTIPGEFGATKHPAQPWLIKLHGAFAMLMLVLLGSVLPGHVKKAWQRRKNLVLGLVLMAAVVVLVVSGYTLYYFVNDDTRGFVSALHWVTGTALLPIFVGHMLTGLKSAQRHTPLQLKPPTSVEAAHTSAARRRRLAK